MGRKGKHEEWMTEDALLMLRAWARDGLSDKQIAERIGIAESTFYEWKKRYAEFAEALKRGKEPVDIEVENALHRSALGYNAKIKKHFKLKRVEYDPDTGKKVKEWEELQEAEDEVHVTADVTAQKFWLVNRKPEAWREKRSEDVRIDAGDAAPTGVILIPAVRERAEEGGAGE